ncbi:MAG TPA: aldehyde dehydrogenase [Amycolatopsis sp.]|nr:aldehyde dehydrogenase [Amycolatopsis sp.]
MNTPQNLVAGTWQTAAAIPGRCNTDPNTGEVRHPMVTTSPADVERALATADDLHRAGQWQAFPEGARAEALRRIADFLEERIEDIAVEDSLTSGVPITTTRLVAGFIPGRFRTAAEDCLAQPRLRKLEASGRDVRLLRLPWGPAAVLTPWNAPSFIAASKIASALAAGCPVLFKPSEWAASTARVLAEAVVHAELPPGAFQVLHGAGDVGAALASDRRVKIVCFTGGSVAGRSIARAAAEDFKVLQLELGGNNPVLVLRDADVSATAASLARGMTLLNGQWCEGPGKVLVHRDLVGELTDALAAQLAQITVGPSLEVASELGPLSHEAHRDRLVGQIEGLRARGATIVQPATVARTPGWFLPATFSVGTDPDSATEELFGPVLSVHAVDSDEAALEHANRHPSGLDAYVYGQDTEHALDIAARVLSGEVRVNGAHLADLGEDSAQSFWGESGIGGHGPAESARVFSGTRVVGVDSEDLVI